MHAFLLPVAQPLPNYFVARNIYLFNRINLPSYSALLLSQEYFEWCEWLIKD